MPVSARMLAGRGVNAGVARRVDRERDVASGDRGHHSADGRTDGQHRRPGGAGERIGRQQLFLARDVRNRRRPRRFEKGRCGDREGHHAVRNPHLIRRAHEQQSQNQEASHHVGDDHQAPPVHAIDDNARERTDDRDRQKLHNHHPGDGRGRAGEVQQQGIHGDRVEPVAQLRDRLPDEEQAEVAVAAEEREVNAFVMSRGSRAHADPSV